MFDIFSLLDRLATLLAKERTHSLTYIGCMKKGPVITDPKMKWYHDHIFLTVGFFIIFTVWHELLLVACLGNFSTISGLRNQDI